MEGFTGTDEKGIPAEHPEHEKGEENWKGQIQDQDRGIISALNMIYLIYLKKESG